jgi:hypothetical protein
VNVVVQISDAFGRVIYRIINRDTVGVMGLPAGASWFRCHIEDPRLLPGRYAITGAITNGRLKQSLDWVADAVEMEIAPADVYGTGLIPKDGVGFVRCRWDNVPSQEGDPADQHSLVVGERM